MGSTRKKILQLFLAHGVISTDTRTIQNDDLFFALKGENFNGNKYAEIAINKGAKVAIVDEEDYVFGDQCILVSNVLKSLQELAMDYRQLLDIPVFAITGSNGKTTTKELINSVLSVDYKVHSTPGNFNNHIGVPLTILSAPKDTELLLIEMGASFAGEIAELCEIANPTHGLITNISGAHMEGFGDIQTVIKTKTALYRYLTKYNGVIFVNGEDDHLLDLVDSQSEVIEYFPHRNLSIEKSSDPRLTWAYVEEGSYCVFKTNLVGSYNIYNLMAAIAVGQFFDINDGEILSALQTYQPANNRSQLLSKDGNQYILDAYNANPASMELSIANMQTIDHQKKVIVLGDMLELGKEEVSAHQTIVDFIGHTDWSEVLLVGPLFGKTNMPSNYLHFDTVDQLKTYTDQHPFDNALILLKGSRGIALEKIVNSNI